MRRKMKKELQATPWLPQTAAPDVTFVNATLIDVEAGKVHLNSSFRVRDGIIVEVSTGSSAGRHDSSSQVVDLQHRFVCPGLIDCHVHVTATPGSLLLKELFSASPNAIAYRSLFVAKEMLLRGFTTVRDTGGADAALRDAINEGLVRGPRLFIAGKALSQTGGHGDFRASYQATEAKCCGGHSHSLARICDGVPQCLEAVRDELRQGADFIKIMCGGGVATPTDALEMLQFTAEEIQAITTTARYSGKYVTAHAYTVEAIRHAVDNGVRGIEHGNFIDRETALYCKEKGVTFTPTLVTYYGMMEPPFDHFLNEASLKKNRQVLASGLEALKILRDAGVTMCYGSDLLAGLHALQNGEFRIRASVLSAIEILQSATVNAARLLGMEGKLGCLKADAIADFLILSKNPLDDITVLDRMSESLLAIVKDGRIVTSKLDELRADPLYHDMELA
jgi:imidazolonepropionase-like amidohydrolase